MDKRFWVCGLVMSTAALLLGLIVHGLLLAPDYAALGAMFRRADDSRHYANSMVLAPALTALATTWIDAHGISDGRSSSLQALGFGLALADRTRDVKGNGVTGRVDYCGRRIIKKNKT